MSTFFKNIDDLTVYDLQEMAESNMKEDQHHEFKRDIPNSDSFCAAITSFSNTYGGDLFLGIDAPEGGNITLSGITTMDTDKDLLRLTNILQSGIEPKLPRIQHKTFEVGENSYVFLFRVGRSWLRPHRVKNNEKFYARKSNGKFSLDVYELRQMFNEGSEFSNKIRQFREERVLHHVMAFNESPFTLVHLIPISCFENRHILDLSLFEQLKLAPIASTGWNPSINFHGIYSNANNESTLQIFRNGIIEGATIRLTKEKEIRSALFVDTIIQFVQRNIDNYHLMGMKEPFYVSISMFGVAGFKLSLNPMRFFDSGEILIEDKFIFPEVLIEEKDNINDKLTPIFDTLWNAFGFPKYIK